MSEINSQALREAAEQAMHDDWGFDADLFHELVTPSIVLELLDERERNQQYIKRRDQENEDIALTVGKLRVELETAKSKLNEQREYYEGVISDGSKRIAKLESNEVREDGNQFLVVRHPGKTPVIKHCTGIEAENINDCYDHWMIWAQIAHADITNIRIEELKEHQAA